MIKLHQRSALEVGAAPPISDIPFAERVFTAKQTQRALAVGKTTFFEKVLPELEAYLDGNRLKITGRSIQAYRERRLAEPRGKRSIEQLTRTAPQHEGDAA